MACLLTIGRGAGVERDEDVEVVDAVGRAYLQIKTRNRPIQPADIAEALERFEILRGEHEQARRPGAARFSIVANVEPGPELGQRLAAATWPGDVAFVSPERARPDGELPPAWQDIDAALAWCRAAAAEVPFGALSPQTLV